MVKLRIQAKGRYKAWAIDLEIFISPRPGLIAKMPDGIIIAKFDLPIRDFTTLDFFASVHYLFPISFLPTWIRIGLCRRVEIFLTDFEIIAVNVSMGKWDVLLVFFFPAFIRILFIYFGYFFGNK